MSQLDENNVKEMLSTLGNKYEIGVLNDHEDFPLKDTDKGILATKIPFKLENAGLITCIGQYPQFWSVDGVVVTINGSTYLEPPLKKVREIKIESNSPSIYRYIIWVYGCGPDSGGRTYSFTDETNDTYKLLLWSTTVKWHYVRYNSSQPAIKKISWDYA